MERLSTDQLQQWMSHYYENPRPDLTPTAIAALRDGGYLSGESASGPIMAFLSFIFHSHPEQIETWLSPFKDLPNQENLVIVYALWYSNTRQAREYLAALSETADSEMSELITSLLNESPPLIEQIQISDPSVLDMLWAAFMATGDEKYVIKLISALPYINSEDDSAEQLIGESARWSLISNAIKYEKVMGICVDQLTRQSEKVASILTEIITEAENSPENS